MRVVVIAAAMIAPLALAPASAQVPQPAPQGTSSTAQPTQELPERKRDERRQHKDELRKAVEGIVQSVLAPPPPREPPPPPRDWSPPPPREWPSAQPVEADAGVIDSGEAVPVAIPDPPPDKPSAPAPSASTPRPAPAATVPVATRPRAEPSATVPERPAPVVTPPDIPPPVAPPEPQPAVTAQALPQPVAVEPVRPAAQAQPASLEPRPTIPAWWVLAALVAAAAAIAAALRYHRYRRLARTRAALSLAPRLEGPTGDADMDGLKLNAPPFAIRCRLEPVPDHG